MLGKETQIKRRTACISQWTINNHLQREDAVIDEIERATTTCAIIREDDIMKKLSEKRRKKS
jgi:hypothetical protein